MYPSSWRVGSDIRGVPATYGFPGTVSGPTHPEPPMDRPRVLSSSAVIMSAGSSVLQPDPPDSVPRWDFTSSRLYPPPCPSRVLRAGAEPFPALHDVLWNRAAVPTPQSLSVPMPVTSRKIPAFTLWSRARPLDHPSTHFCWGPYFDATPFASCYGPVPR